MHTMLYPCYCHRFSAFGIGNSVDRDLVEKIAKAGHGDHKFVTSMDRSMETSVMNAMRGVMVASATDFQFSLVSEKDVSLNVRDIPSTICLGESKMLFATLEGKVYIHVYVRQIVAVN